MKVTYKQHCGDDLTVVNAARVSFDKESTFELDYLEDEYFKTVLSERDAKLINYLARENHKSPFNHTFITLHVKAPIFVARQLQKHEYMPINEVSRRYVTTEPEFYVPEVWRKKADNVKQGSSDEEYRSRLDTPFMSGTVSEVVDCAMQDMVDLYRQMVADGCAPEQARMVLPQSMYTEWFWSGTLFAWAKMYNLRITSDTQRETQEIARQVGEIIEPLFPVSWQALTT